MVVVAAAGVVTRDGGEGVQRQVLVQQTAERETCSLSVSEETRSFGHTDQIRPSSRAAVESTNTPGGRVTCEGRRARSCRCRARSLGAAGWEPRSRHWAAGPGSPEGQSIVFMIHSGTMTVIYVCTVGGGRLTSRTPSASMTTVQVPGFRTKGSTKGTLTKVGSTLGAKTIGLDCSEPSEQTGSKTWRTQ